LRASCELREGPSSPSNARWNGCRGAGPCQALAAEGGGRKARLYKGPSVPGYNRHRRTDGLRFKTTRSRQASRRALHHRESRSSWRDFLTRLKQRGLFGVEFVVSDDHEGLKGAISEVLPGAAWQRCYVHFLRNALDDVPRKVDDDCLQELRWIYDRRELAEVRRDIAQWLTKWQGKYPKLCDWAEDNIEQTLTYYRRPLAHPKHMKSTNMLERLNQELKRRTHVVRIFPNVESWLRLVLALAVETHGGTSAEAAHAPYLIGVLGVTSAEVG
jgi:putative transposase